MSDMLLEKRKVEILLVKQQSLELQPSVLWEEELERKKMWYSWWTHTNNMWKWSGRLLHSDWHYSSRRKELKKVLFNKAVKVLNIFSPLCLQENNSLLLTDDFVWKDIQEETLDPQKHYQRSSR